MSQDGAASVEEDNSSAEWACEVCTYENAPALVRCEMCQTRNPNIAQKAIDSSTLMSLLSMRLGLPDPMEGFLSPFSSTYSSKNYQQQLDEMRAAREDREGRRPEIVIEEEGQQEQQPQQQPSLGMKRQKREDNSSGEQPERQLELKMLSEEHRKFREELAPGSLVDCFMPASKRWCIAQIAEHDEATDEFTVMYLEFDECFNRKVKRLSTFLAPERSKSVLLTEQGGNTNNNENSSNSRAVAALQQLSSLSSLIKCLNADDTAVVEQKQQREWTEEELKWRESLQVGDMLDALDQQNQWYLSEVKDIRHVGGEEGKGDQKKTEIFIHFVEWSEKWNVWYNILSPNIAPFKSKSKLKTEQDTNTILANAILKPDYSNVNIEHLPTSVLRDRCLPPRLCSSADARKNSMTRFVRVSMPKDNSCFFHAMSFLCEKQAPRSRDNVLRNRLRCATLMNDNATQYADFLGEQSVEQYTEGMKGMLAWGGGIELGIMAEFFEVEIVALDVVSCVCYKFPHDSNRRNHSSTTGNYNSSAEAKQEEGKGLDSFHNDDGNEGNNNNNSASLAYKRRVYVLYHGEHYDALAAYNTQNKQLQEVFCVDDEVAFQLAKSCAEMLHLQLSNKEVGDVLEWKGHGSLDGYVVKPPSLVRQHSNPSALVGSAAEPIGSFDPFRGLDLYSSAPVSASDTQLNNLTERQPLFKRSVSAPTHTQT